MAKKDGFLYQAKNSKTEISVGTKSIGPFATELQFFNFIGQYIDASSATSQAPTNQRARYKEKR